MAAWTRGPVRPTAITATGPVTGPRWIRRWEPRTTFARWWMRRTGTASASSWTPSSTTPGPPTPKDPPWPDDWVRTSPNCTYKDYATTVDCNLVAHSPRRPHRSRRTGRSCPLRCSRSGRARGAGISEVAELDAFFRRTRLPPRSALLHHQVAHRLGARVRLRRLSGGHRQALRGRRERSSSSTKRSGRSATGSRAHPAQVLDSLPFYMVGEVYGWEPSQGREYDYGDRNVDFFANGYDGLINFGFKRRCSRFARRSVHPVFDDPRRRRSPRRHHSQLPQLSRRRLALRRRSKGPARRRHPPPPRSRHGPDLLRRRAGEAAQGPRRRGRRESPLSS